MFRMVSRDGSASEEGRPSLGAARTSTSDAPAALRPKIEAFGKYRILGEMGHGGMADVYVAVDIGPAGIGKLQVIKRLRSGLAEDAELRAMLLDEARLAARLNHRNIVQTMEVGSVDDQYFIAMELLDGQPLNRIQRRCKSKGETFPLPLMLEVLSEVLAGLHYAHEAKD
jgi:eukaryotic-like serine/threonine-protein kinase